MFLSQICYFPNLKSELKVSHSVYNYITTENACGETLKLLGSFSQLIGRGGHGARPLAASPPIRSGNEDWKYSAEEVQSASSSLYSSPHTPLTDQNFKTENKCTDCLTRQVTAHLSGLLKGLGRTRTTRKELSLRKTFDPFGLQLQLLSI